MDHPFLLLAAIAALGLVYVIVPLVLETFTRFRKPRMVNCPEDGRLSTIQIDAKSAAMTAVTGHSKLLVKGCSLWPQRSGCAKNCLTHCRY